MSDRFSCPAEHNVSAPPPVDQCCYIVEGSTEEREEVKKVARQLLERLNTLLVLGWRQKIQSRAKVRIAIEDTLDAGLPRAYTKELYAKKTEVRFEHVYEAYAGEGQSVFNQ